MERWHFDCDGHYQVTSGMGFSPEFYAAPRSVAGHIAGIACGRININHPSPGARSDTSR
jgi:hypothetical protein